PFLLFCSFLMPRPPPDFYPLSLHDALPISRFDPLVVTPLSNGALVRSTGIRRVEELDWWDDAKTAPLPITLTPAQHFSARGPFEDRKSTRLNSSHGSISYAVFCLKKKKNTP